MTQLIYKQKKSRNLFEAFRLSKHKKNLLLKQLIQCGQGHVLTSYLFSSNLSFLQKVLRDLDNFYMKIDGVLGYQRKINELLLHKTQSEAIESVEAFDSDMDVSYSLKALNNIEKVAEFIVLGGAAHRFNRESKVKQAQALEEFLGVSFLESLIQDVFAREYLSYKKTGRQVHTPIYMMSSKINGNHNKIMRFLKKKDYFARVRDLVWVHQQPLVPQVDKNGGWILDAEGRLELKPSGHGAIWNLAMSHEVFVKLEMLGCEYILTRQINNMMSGTDHTILSFLGYGIEKKHCFGFVCVKRDEGMQEGICVAKRIDGKRVLSSIEYCDAKKSSLDDGFKYSNTNILFSRLDGLKQAVKKNPFPGLLLNFKGSEKTRLESTMQVISESMIENQYLFLAKRQKALSVIKKKMHQKADFFETAQSALYDYCQNQEDLLENYCSIDLPHKRELDVFLDKGPSFLFTYLPALGPTYSEIKKKMVGGKIHEGSVLDLQIVDISCNNLDLKGSLSIKAQCPMGHFNTNGELVFSKQAARVDLDNLVIRTNLKHKELKSCLKNPSKKPACDCNIILEEGGCLVIKNMIFDSPRTIRVRKNEKLILEG